MGEFHENDKLNEQLRKLKEIVEKNETIPKFTEEQKKKFIEHLVKKMMEQDGK